MKRCRNLQQSLWYGLLSAFVGIAIPLVWSWTLIAPAGEAVKVRSALTMSLGGPGDFDWFPGNMPSSFLRDEHGPPVELQRIALGLSGEVAPAERGEFQEALSIVKHLATGIKRIDGPIHAGLMETYEAIRSEGKGYCADFAKIFTGLAVAVGIPVRSWTISFQGFGAGHIFNEVYDRNREKWILIDSFQSLYFADPDTGEPLSVIEVHNRLLKLGTDKGLSVVPIVPRQYPFRSEALAQEYFLRGMRQLALLWGNSVFDYDQPEVVQWTANLSRGLSQFLAIALGIYPRAKIYPIGVSEKDLMLLARTREDLLLASASVLVSICLFGFHAWVLVRGRDKSRSRRQ
jgi:hypothetical protein